MIVALRQALNGGQGKGGRVHVAAAVGEVEGTRSSDGFVGGAQVLSSILQDLIVDCVAWSGASRGYTFSEEVRPVCVCVWGGGRETN